MAHRLTLAQSATYRIQVASTLFIKRKKACHYPQGKQRMKTKTKLNRVVPNAKVREVLNQQGRTSEFVFTSLKTGERLNDVKKAFNTARVEAGIPDFQLRDLRHSCATRLSDRGEELVTVAEILGRTDIRMTKRYSHGMQERKREPLEKLVSGCPRQRDAKNVAKQKRQGARPAVSH
jgi:integrase